MTVGVSLLVFKFALMTGLGVWMTIIVINNLAAFGGGVASVGRMMSMELFDQEPAIESPLLVRRVTGTFWHRVTYAFVLLLEAGAAVLLCYAALGFASALFGSLPADDAVVRANIALSIFASMAFVLALGGAWFAYYIRQEAMQITHFVLIGVAIATVGVVNLPTP